MLTVSECLWAIAVQLDPNSPEEEIALGVFPQSDKFRRELQGISKQQSPPWKALTYAVFGTKEEAEFTLAENRVNGKLWQGPGRVVPVRMTLSEVSMEEVRATADLGLHPRWSKGKGRIGESNAETENHFKFP